MIRFVQGNLFDSRAQALVNTVNCVGVMGKGIAYQFKRAFPAMYADYAARCRSGEVQLGKMSTFREGDRLIINFPTKDHWRSGSRLEDIEAGLVALRELVKEEAIRSVALPPLGCGNGGLRWGDVKRRIEEILGVEELESVEFEVYEPAGRPFESQVAREPRLSLGHYVLAALRARLAQPSRLQLQKAAYFFNVFSGESYFKFIKHKYGPYSQGIEPMSSAIRDYLAYSRMSVDAMVEHGLRHKLRGADAARLRAWLPVVARVATFCNAHAADIEALSTAHAIVAETGPVAEDALITAFLGWSVEKAEKFDRQDVIRALAMLERTGLIRRGLFGLELQAPAS